VTRDEAMAMAISAANAASGFADPGLAEARARVGELWLDIADRLPTEEQAVTDASPISQPFSDELMAEVRAEDEEVVIMPCGHRMNALLHRGRWLHPYSLDVCDLPPVKRAER
jgi:hypothetical protein